MVERLVRQIVTSISAAARGQGVVDDLEFDRRNLGHRTVHVHPCPPRHEVAASVAPATPSLDEQDAGVGFLDDGRSLDRAPGKTSSRLHTATSRQPPESQIFRLPMGCPLSRATAALAVGLGKRPMAEARNDTISTANPDSNRRNT
jgi:hypothetical protein